MPTEKVIEAIESTIIRNFRFHGEMIICRSCGWTTERPADRECSTCGSKVMERVPLSVRDTNHLDDCHVKILINAIVGGEAENE